MTIELRDFAEVNVVTQPAGEPTRELGKVLFFTTDDTIAASGSDKQRTYNGIRGVEEDFSTTSEPYIAANRWFQQDPYPSDFVIGRWAELAANTEVRGGAPATLATLTAISDGSFSIGNQDFTSLNLSSAGDYAAIATALQTLIRAQSAFSAVSVSYVTSPSRFVVSFPITVTNAAVFTPHNTAGTGTDVSSPLGLDAASGAELILGSAAESETEALIALDAIDDSWHFANLEKRLNGTSSMILVDQYCATHKKLFPGESNENDALTTNESTSFAAQVSARTSERTWITYSGTQDYKSLSSAARLSSIDFNAPRSQITLNLRTMVGTLPDNLSTTQKRELERKRINYVERTRNNPNPLFIGGYTCSPDRWIDERYWLDWFEDALTVAGFNHLVQTPWVGQIPSDLQALREAYENVFELGISNGRIAPGFVTAEDRQAIITVTGRTDFDGFLPNGYLVHVGNLALHPDTEKLARNSPPFNAWGIMQQATHKTTLRVKFS